MVTLVPVCASQLGNTLPPAAHQMLLFVAAVSVRRVIICNPILSLLWSHLIPLPFFLPRCKPVVCVCACVFVLCVRESVNVIYSLYLCVYVCLVEGSSPRHLSMYRPDDFPGMDSLLVSLVNMFLSFFT